MKNCIRPHYEKLNPLKSGFIENSNFENNRDPWEASLTLALLLLLLMAILGRQAGLVGQQEVLHLGAAMLIIGVVSWQIGEHYKEERKVSWN